MKRPDIKQIDALICQWTIDSGTAVSEKALNDLVDRIACAKMIAEESEKLPQIKTAQPISKEELLIKSKIAVDTMPNDADIRALYFKGWRDAEEFHGIWK